MRFGKMRFVQLLVLVLTVSVFASMMSKGNKKHDMAYVGADFQSFFYSISQLAGYDILLAPDVRGTISISVTQKTWPEIMDIVCNLYDLTWQNEGNYISVQRTASYQQKIISAAEKREQSDMVAPLIRRSFRIRHATASEMAAVLDAIKSPRGRISVVERNNAIIVYDTERRLEQMQNTLSELDIETLQIVITAKLVYVNSSLANELGVDWTNINVNTSNSRIEGEFANQPTGKAQVIDTEGGAGASTAITAATTLGIKAFDGRVSAAIQNLLTDSRTEILASPQISTLDHTQATIFMGDEVSIRTVDINGQPVEKMIETGIKLTVTPHVAGDNRILLELKPQNNGFNYENGTYVITKQEAETKVVVADGETVVIGGLTKSEDLEAETGIPFLKDIPILGYLFKYTRKEVRKKDLVIFVTPRIMRNYLENSSVSTDSENTAPSAKPVEEYEYSEEEDEDDGWE